MSLPSLSGITAGPAPETTLNMGKVPVLAAVPKAPSIVQRDNLISSVSGIGPGEAYSNDEEQLNNFIKLHPMLSLVCLADGSNSCFAHTL